MRSSSVIAGTAIPQRLMSTHSPESPLTRQRAGLLPPPRPPRTTRGGHHQLPLKEKRRWASRNKLASSLDGIGKA